MAKNWQNHSIDQIENLCSPRVWLENCCRLFVFYAEIRKQSRFGISPMDINSNRINPLKWRFWFKLRSNWKFQSMNLERHRFILKLPFWHMRMCWEIERWIRHVYVEHNGKTRNNRTERVIGKSNEEKKKSVIEDIECNRQWS